MIEKELLDAFKATFKVNCVQDVLKASFKGEEQLTGVPFSISGLAHDCVEVVKAVMQQSKTPKQVASGYHRPVCLKDNCELRPEKNGVGVIDMADWGPYELYDADLWKCPKCGMEVVGGFAVGPIAMHFESNFEKLMKDYKDRGLLIVNRG